MRTYAKQQQILETEIGFAVMLYKSECSLESLKRTLKYMPTYIVEDISTEAAEDYDNIVDSTFNTIIGFIKTIFQSCVKLIKGLWNITIRILTKIKNYFVQYNSKARALMRKLEDPAIYLAKCKLFLNKYCNDLLNEGHERDANLAIMVRNYAQVARIKNEKDLPIELDSAAGIIQWLASNNHRQASIPDNFELTIANEDNYKLFNFDRYFNTFDNGLPKTHKQISDHYFRIIKMYQEQLSFIKISEVIKNSLKGTNLNDYKEQTANILTKLIEPINAISQPSFNNRNEINISPYQGIKFNTSEALQVLNRNGNTVDAFTEALMSVMPLPINFNKEFVNKANIVPQVQVKHAYEYVKQLNNVIVDIQNTKSYLFNKKDELIDNVTPPSIADVTRLLANIGANQIDDNIKKELIGFILKIVSAVSKALNQAYNQWLMFGYAVLRITSEQIAAITDYVPVLLY